MAVQIDTSRAVRTTGELARLVQEIAQALTADELDWIEWKSGYGLREKPTEGTMAGHILGMANRQPEEALLHAEGCGYLVIGAEPGNLCGVTAIDPSDLDQGLQPYLGPEGPAWSPHYVQDGGVTVLVITVEPPRAGHRIFTLQKEFTVTNARGDAKTYLAGTVFVRHRARTVQAEPGDIRALEERFAAPAQEAEVYARRTLEIAEARQAAEEADRRRRGLAELSRLVASVLFKVSPLASMGMPVQFRCEEQIQLGHLLAGMEAADLPAVKSVAGASQAHEAFASAARANIEIEAAMQALTTQHG